MTSTAVTLDDPPVLLEQFLTGYWSARTQASDAFIIGGWFAWGAGREHDPMRDADAPVIERWIADMQHRSYAANTIAARVSAWIHRLGVRGAPPSTVRSSRSPRGGTPAPRLEGLASELLVRRAPVPRFPHHVAYLAADDGIHVLAVPHDERRPATGRTAPCRAGVRPAVRAIVLWQQQRRTGVTPFGAGLVRRPVVALERQAVSGANVALPTGRRRTLNRMGVSFIAVGLTVVAWALVDIWRRSGEPTPFRWGWSVLALGGQFTLPGWRLGDGWYAAVPLGAIAYLILARSGPLRRRRRDSHDGEHAGTDAHPRSNETGSHRRRDRTRRR